MVRFRVAWLGVLERHRVSRRAGERNLGRDAVPINYMLRAARALSAARDDVFMREPLFAVLMHTIFAWAKGLVKCAVLSLPSNRSIIDTEVVHVKKECASRHQGVWSFWKIGNIIVFFIAKVTTSSWADKGIWQHYVSHFLNHVNFKLLYGFVLFWSINYLHQNKIVFKSSYNIKVIILLLNHIIYLYIIN